MQLTNLETSFIGKNFSFYDSIDSTQAEIWRLIENKRAKNGQIVMANIQTAGIGTHGRIWHTDERENIAFSMYIETCCSPKKLEGITVEIAEIIVEIFKRMYGIDIDIKSPNDLVINGKKIGGILTESKAIEEQVKYLVIGIGVNTNKLYFPDDIKNIATSIKKEHGIIVNNFEIVSQFCNKFEKKIKERIGN